MLISDKAFSWRNPHLSGRIPELDGIRGLAILLVLVFHYIEQSMRLYVQLHPGRFWLTYVLGPLRLTWSGVDLFFVLSGFLIGGILYDAKYAKAYYQTFYLRRFHRIFPLYFAWLALFLIGLQFVGSNSSTYLQSVFNRGVPIWLFPLFLQNFFYAFARQWGARWMRVTWSLCVEEQFYLLLPAIIRKLSIKNIIGLTLGAILFAPSLRVFLIYFRYTHFAAYTLLPCRADSLGLGVLLAIASRNQQIWEWLTSHRKYIYLAFLAFGLGVGVLSIAAPAGRVMDTVGYSWFAVFYALLLLLVLASPGRIERRVFRNPLLVKLGCYAYAVYLSHQGINILWHLAVGQEGTEIYDLPSLLATIGALVTVLSLAALSWRFFERPLIQRAHSKYHYVKETEVAASV